MAKGPRVTAKQLASMGIKEKGKAGVPVPIEDTAGLAEQVRVLKEEMKALKREVRALWEAKGGLQVEINKLKLKRVAK